MDDTENFDDPNNFLFECRQHENRRSEWPRPIEVPYSMEPEALTLLRNREAELVLGQGNAVRVIPPPVAPGKVFSK